MSMSRPASRDGGSGARAAQRGPTAHRVGGPIDTSGEQVHALAPVGQAGKEGM